MLQYTEFVQRIKDAYNSLSNILKEQEIIEEDCIEAFKDVVKICIPSAEKLLNAKDWKRLWKKYQQRAKDILQTQATINNCYYFIDYALIFTDDRYLERDRIQTYKLYNAFNNTVQSLNKEIQTDKELINKFQKKLDKKIIEAITDGPKKSDSSNNSAFKNFVNEIAFFHYVAIHRELELADVETSMPNGKYADFKLKCGGEYYLVDTITIHNISTQDNINRFIEGKIDDKYSAKTNNLTEEPILNRFRVLPFIEYNDTRLLDYVPELPNTKCFPPMIYLVNEISGSDETNDKYNIIFEQLPLSDELKKQLNNEQ